MHLLIHSLSLIKLVYRDLSMEKSHKNYIITQILFRVMAFLATLVASLLMALNKQTRDLGGFSITASYKSSPAFEFFVIGNAVVCGYSLVSLPLVLKTMVKGYALPILDLISMGLVMASASAATAIAYLGKRGNPEIGWSSVCPYYSKFCDRAGISLFFAFLGFLLFLIICSLSSVHKTRLITTNA